MFLSFTKRMLDRSDGQCATLGGAEGAHSLSRRQLRPLFPCGTSLAKGRSMQNRLLNAVGLILIGLSSYYLRAAEAESQLPDERNEALKVQLFLDKAGFGPGRLDARWGEFTKKAVTRWNDAEMSPEIPVKDGELGELPKDLWSDQLLTEYKITDADQELVGELPEEPEAKGELDRLPYADLLEAVSEKFHAYPEFILELNQMEEGSKLSVGDSIIVPNVSAPFDLAAVKDKGDSDDGKETEVSVLKSEEIVEVRQDGKLVHSFPITVGADGNSSPAGDWKIDVVQWMPEFRYDKQMLKEGERSDEGIMMPPGPNNPVGIVWIGLDADGIGLHGTAHPNTIGRSASHGCIRLANWDAALLGEMVKVGDAVVIK